MSKIKKKLVKEDLEIFDEVHAENTQIKDDFTKFLKKYEEDVLPRDFFGKVHSPKVNTDSVGEELIVGNLLNIFEKIISLPIKVKKNAICAKIFFSISPQLLPELTTNGKFDLTVFAQSERISGNISSKFGNSFDFKDPLLSLTTFLEIISHLKISEFSQDLAKDLDFVFNQISSFFSLSDSSIGSFPVKFLSKNGSFFTINLDRRFSRLGGLKFKPEEVLFLIERGVMVILRPNFNHVEESNNILCQRESKYEKIENLWLIYLCTENININQYQVSGKMTI
ncbi:hypothetical protein AYI68_g41 [Smittium mucronatum]|uniref:Uncharacterized protein n=1 Tax=Smittium mucronatum TaxID=133383 RepID=A0A1R0H9B9_9FUNG|nr:hypothetical protein AYI68_g41 [Smittium mucronatum]